jgi:hypothetical protein
MTMIKKVLSLFASIGLLLSFQGCKKDTSPPQSPQNNPPFIQSVSSTPASTPSNRIGSGTNVTLSVIANDQDGDNLTYFWSASHGILMALATSTVTWQAPVTSSDESDTAYVTVSDGVATAVSQIALFVAATVVIDPSESSHQLATGNVWQYLEYVTAGSTSVPPYVVSVRILKDTIINGKSYSMLTYSGLLNTSPSGDSLWQNPTLARYDSITGNYFEYSLSSQNEVLADSTFCVVTGTYTWGSLALRTDEMLLGAKSTSREIQKNYAYDKYTRGLGRTASSRVGFRINASLGITYAKINGKEYGIFVP